MSTRVILAIDDRPHELGRLRECASAHGCMLLIHVFRDIDSAVEETAKIGPEIVLVGHGLSSFPITGSHVIRALRQAGYNGIIAGNSGGGSAPFEADGVAIDFAVDRNEKKLRNLLEEN